MTVLDFVMPIVAFLFGYLLGGIPTSIIVGKLFFHQDPRDYGSKNPGGTNATRLWGKKVGFSIIAFDMIKSIAPFWIMLCIFRFTPLNTDTSLMCQDAINWGIWLTALGSCLGHCYSIYLKFQGGKGVSTYIGSLGSSNFIEFIIGFFTFLGTLFTKKIVSLASITMCVIATIVAWTLFGLWAGYGAESAVGQTISYWFIFNSSMISMHIAYPVCVTLMSIFVIVRHRANIKRLINHEEKKIFSKH